tara:strand:+ start:1501 stop:1851 length:351 start_codon:yes stop_codon:yes gene_type:complete
MGDYLRSQKTSLKYRNFKRKLSKDHGCPLCQLNSIKNFSFWKIVKNDFPYDKVATNHDMLMPIRCTTEENLTAEEKLELEMIKSTTAQSYDLLAESTLKTMSVASHYHIHLLDIRD